MKQESWTIVGPSGMRFADRPRWIVGVLRMHAIHTNSALFPAVECATYEEAYDLRARLSRGERGPE